MTIPDYQALMAPVLHVLNDGREHSISEIREAVAGKLGLSEADLRETVPSGQKALFNDRLSWSVTYMKQAGVLERVSRGVYRISQRGRGVLREQPDRIDNSALERFEEFRAFRERSRSKGDPGHDSVDVTESSDTPEESLESAYRRLRATIESELLDQVRRAPPDFFERLVVQLLVAMGYGGSLKDAGQAVGRTGDGGIDGVIKEDRLGLDLIHIQAKRWDGHRTVGRPDVQSFAGSLDGVRARKGIFITTASFSTDARHYVDRIEKKIVLIDGAELASLMYDFGIGVSPGTTYTVRRIDSDYFGEE
jgi:restriction system protein